MKILFLTISLLIVGCSTVPNNEAYYILNSGTGWEQDIEAADVKNYVPWEKAIDTLLENPAVIDAVGQGHSLEVHILFKNDNYMGTIEPDIDTIFMVINKCGKPCEHISQITE
jgi:hypothetical protein